GACHLLERKISLEVSPSSECLMTPADHAQLQQHVAAIADILYRNTPTDQLQTLEGIEQTWRAQAQQTVLPQLGIFLSRQLRRQLPATPDR
ncbi:hypothetical protein KR51_00028240, partial [Rubidibacter lacunae KORDI 51-2]